MDIDPDKWFYDRVSRNLIQLHSIEDVLYTGQSKFQSIEIIRSGSFGKCLVLDGKIQSSEEDEFIYHEALVQPAMLTHQGMFSLPKHLRGELSQQTRLITDNNPMYIYHD